MRQLMFVLCFLALGISASAQVRTVTPKDWVMTSDAAFKWFEQTVTPILLKHGNDPKELPAVTRRIAKLSSMLAAKTIDYQAEPFFYPITKTTLAHTDYDTVAKRPILMVFVPALQDLQKTVSARAFEDKVLLTIAHEMIHVEQEENREFPLRANQPWNAAGMQEEAAAWGKTIIEIVRPWAKQGRVPEQAMLKNSEELAKLKDDYHDPRWVLAFANYEPR
jgi:hypothetical protein